MEHRIFRLQDIRARAAKGRAVTLEETWLDGGPALRMNRTFRPGGALLVHENAFEGPGWTGARVRVGSGGGGGRLLERGLAVGGRGGGRGAGERLRQ
jgi:hypothetical protein